jgi:endonuclease/exonuclease/phosphatase family metal-dependent hydrolase
VLCTFNIRYDARHDKGAKSWEARRNLTAETIKKINPDILGLQEVLLPQLHFLKEKLPEFEHLGVGREDGKNGGEFSPLFFRKDKYKALKHGSFWLSETPEIPGSSSWDNRNIRLCTWGELRDQRTKKKITVYNTHWDHQGQQSRINSAALILSRMKTFAHGPTILMGDFNATERNPALKKLTDANFSNAYLSLHSKQKNRNTFHPWNGKRAGQKTIDHLFLRGTGKVLQSWIEHHHRGTMWPSDHFPVVAVIAD